MWTFVVPNCLISRISCNDGEFEFEYFCNGDVSRAQLFSAIMDMPAFN